MPRRRCCRSTARARRCSRSRRRSSTRRDPSPLVVCPNPFYQIYEGAALLAGAEPAFLNQTADDGFALDFDSLDDEQWRAYAAACTSARRATRPGRVLTLDDWRTLFELSDRHGFVIASDECYSEIYDDEAPPLGGLEAAMRLGRDDFRNLVVFVSLSKRSNAPGLRSGGVAGDAAAAAARSCCTAPIRVAR